MSLTSDSSVEARLESLLEAGIAIASGLDLDRILGRLVELACALTDARHGALGVLDETGNRLSRFITTGVDDDLRRTIGDLPHGRGILGLLIHDQQVLRLHDLTEHPASVGFPPGHPPMRSFLGVPVQLRGVAFGNLYLCEKDGERDFGEDDEEIVSLLASQAAIAIENAKLYESATHWLRQVETLNEVGSAMLEEVDLPRLLALVARRLRELVGAKLVVISLPIEAGQLRIEATDGGGAESLVGRTRDFGRTKVGRVFTRRRSERVDSLVDDPEVDRESLLQIVEATGVMPRTALYAPLVKRDRSVGLIAIYDREGADPRFGDADQRLAETFADRAAVAVDLSQRVARDTNKRREGGGGSSNTVAPPPDTGAAAPVPSKQSAPTEKNAGVAGPPPGVTPSMAQFLEIKANDALVLRNHVLVNARLELVRIKGVVAHHAHADLICLPV